MKTKSVKALFISLVGLGAMAIVFITSCHKENKVELLAGSTNTGTDIIDARIGGYPPTTYTVPGAWKMDKSHSNVMWATKYYENGALLTGRFNIFSASVNFDQANPANTTIKGWVRLSSTNTGETGRDALGKCGPAYFGVIADTITKVPLLLGARASTDTAWLNSTKVEKYGNGYMVTADFKFRGVTKSFQFPMKYTGIVTSTNATTGLKTNRAGLVCEFGINALTVFGVTATQINDLVTIRLNYNMVTNAY